MIRLAEDPANLGLALPSAGPAVEGSGISITDALRLPSLRAATVLAGHCGLEREVYRVGVWETPDVLPFTRDAELLVTTGYPLLARGDLPPGDLDDHLAAQLSDLAARGVGAVAVKLGAYVTDLPPRALQRADEIGLPVLALPPDVSLDDILSQVLTAVLGRQAALLERSEQVHRGLVQIVLGGGGLPEVAQALSRSLGLTVVVTDPEARVLAQAGLSVDQDAAAGRAVVPIVAGGVRHGRIVALSADREVGPHEVHALERAAMVCALVTVKQLAVSAVEERYQADFLRDVLTGRVDDAGRTARHAAALGWRLDRPVFVVVVQPDPQPGEPPESRTGQLVTDRLATSWRALVLPRDPGAAVCGFATEVVALVGVPGDGDVERVVRELVITVRGDGAGRRSFTTGVSRGVAGLDGIAGAYEQARTCVRVSRQLHGPGGLAHFDRLGVHRLLSLVPDSAELRSFLADTLGELVQPDAQARDLRRTLEVLLDTNLNVAESARRLHFHYNTLRYRIGKLERMLGPFTEDAGLRLDLALALRIAPMRGLGGSAPAQVALPANGRRDTWQSTPVPRPAPGPNVPPC